MRKYLSNVHKKGGAHLQYVNNHYAKFIDIIIFEKHFLNSTTDTQS